MFSSLSKPSYPSTAIGLEKDSITALSLKREGRGQYSIRQAATLDLPAGLVTPSFLERNISDQNEFASYVVGVRQNSGLLGQKKWSVSLPSNAARTAILTLEMEPSARKEAEAILDWKAEQSFGVPAAEMRISKQKISPSRDGKTRYFASAVKLSVIDEYESVFESCGMKAGLIMPRAIGEANWISNGRKDTDSLLISSQSDGFTALLLRGDEPTVVRSVTCEPGEVGDEVYRLLMFYNDRISGESGTYLEKMLLVGKDLIPAKIMEIAAEALGRTIEILKPHDIGLQIPDGGFDFVEIAAPAGLASLG